MISTNDGARKIFGNWWSVMQVLPLSLVVVFFIWILGRNWIAIAVVAGVSAVLAFLASFGIRASPSGFRFRTFPSLRVQHISRDQARSFDWRRDPLDPFRSVLLRLHTEEKSWTVLTSQLRGNIPTLSAKLEAEGFERLLVGASKPERHRLD